jgi:hypothetical protein
VPHRFAILCLCLLPSIAMTEVPPSEPLRMRPAERNDRWRVASSSAARNGEVARHYNLGRQSYAYTARGGWYRPTNYFGEYTYRGVPAAQVRYGHAVHSLHRFSGRVPTRWLRGR